LKKSKGFSVIEVLVAFSIVMMLVFTILPIVTLIRQEETILSDRRYISNRLHDKFQSIIWGTSSFDPIHEEVIRSNRVEFTFENHHLTIKGCAHWENIKERDEKVCLHGVKEK